MHRASKVASSGSSPVRTSASQSHTKRKRPAHQWIVGIIARLWNEHDGHRAGAVVLEPRRFFLGLSLSVIYHVGCPCSTAACQHPMARTTQDGRYTPGTWSWPRGSITPSPILTDLKLRCADVGHICCGKEWRAIKILLQLSLRFVVSAHHVSHPPAET